MHELTAEETTAVGYGRRIPAASQGDAESSRPSPRTASLVAMLDESGPEARPIVVFATS